MPRRSRARLRFSEDEMTDEDMPGPSTGRSRSRRNTQQDETMFQGSQALSSQGSQRLSNVRPSQSSTMIRPSQGTSKKRASQRTSTLQNETMDEPYEFSQATQRGPGDLSVQEEKSFIASVVKYLLVMDRSKYVITRPNIIKAALPNHSKHYRAIMDGVESILREVFGYNLVTLEGSKYILTNNLENHGPHIHFSKSEKAEQVLLFIALAHIFMSDSSGCKEDELFDLFRALNIIEDENFHHEYFGDVEYLLTTKFVKQKYLDYAVVDKTDPPTKHYQWGVRAEKEITPRQVLEFMSKLFDGRALNTWPIQFNIMQSREDLSRKLQPCIALDN